ncbi:probable isoaspartyl peptidase/L-asparaginase CG7860 [Sitophilus oryzae]|uniref:Probable isoaspartyl peptidase/L-asparaginase CG7860 n=1 Tax=Sitophilus oryzae TaxID=7048 RepID=A0A6J2YNV2_SITOR|nr:probable isoaspartyl peptidase/L-asparaginase CG7860 [Sitophilus oryzae]
MSKIASHLNQNKPFFNLAFYSTKYKNMEPILLIHGGAGDIPDSRVNPKHAGIKNSVTAGFKILKDGGTALDAVEEAVRVMELNEAFNCGNFLLV